MSSAMGTLEGCELRLARYVRRLVLEVYFTSFEVGGGGRGITITPGTKEGGKKRTKMAHGVGADLWHDTYSVLRSHETCAATGGVPSAWWLLLWCRPKSGALAAGSSSSA
jgi:hypothetical protein